MSRPPLGGRDVVCVGFAEWRTELRTNQHHLMARLAARGTRVLFVESLGLRRPTLAGRDVRRIARRLVSGLRPPRVEDGVLVLSPLVVPLHGNPLARALNARVLPALVGRAARRAALRDPVLWAYVPQAEVLLDALRPGLVVYHCVDDIAAQDGVDAVSFRAAEARFAARADLVLASSRPLAERMREHNPNVLDAPNVADTERFATALADGPVDAAIAALPRPRLVFTGAVTATKLDLPLLEALARARPDWSLVLVGPVGAGDPATDVSALRRLPNVHLVGLRPYERLPDVLRGADVGLIPYRRTSLTASIYPMKVNEYLAAGLPVVATPLESLRGVDDVEVAGDAGETVAAVERLLAGDGPAVRRSRSERVRANSWDARLRAIDAAVEALG